MTALEDTPAGELTADQLLHLATCKRAVENATPLPPLEYQQRELTIEERLYRTAQDFRSWCPDERLLGQDFAWNLVRLGYSTDEAEDLSRSVGVEWSASGARAA